VPTEAFIWFAYLAIPGLFFLVMAWLISTRLTH
jgi:hypothetical protein